MKKIILLGVIALMLLLTASTAMADTIVWQIGVFDDLYGVTDGTKITGPTDRSTAPIGTAIVDYTDVSTFYSVLVPVTTITGNFTADLSKGAVLLISWSPGASGAEKFSVTLDGTTKSSRTVTGSTCTSDPPDGRCGQVPSYYSNYPGLPYYTEIFDFGPVGSGTETHTLSINYSQGNGIGFDYLELSTPPPECVDPPLGMVSWWPGDENADDIWDANHGLEMLGATYAPGMVGQAFSFDGVNDYVSLGTTQIIGDNTSFTIDAWIKVNSFAADNKQIPIYGEYYDDTFDSKNYLAVGNTQSGLEQRVFFDQFVPTGGYLKSNIQLTPGRWYHVAYTQDGISRHLYIDGTLDNSDSVIETYAGSTPNDVRIGRRGGTADNMRFDGLIDELEIFDRALSEEEIQDIYNAGSAGKCKITNQPPVAMCKGIVISADENCQASITAGQVDEGSYDPDEGDTIELSVNKLGPYDLGEHSVILTVTDESGEFDTCVALVTVNDTTSPVPDVADLPDVTGECSAGVTAPTATDNCAGTVNGTPNGPLTYTEQGTFTVTWTYDDGNGNIATQEQTVIVKDTTPPIIDSFTVEPNVLRPPNHKMILITPTIIASDNCDPDPELEIVLISITMNEGDETLTFDENYDEFIGAGHTTDDIQVIDGAIYLRAERSGKGDGRIYTITYTATDDAGNSATATATVTVPHDQK